MSTRDPIDWLKTNLPGDLYNEVDIYLKDGVPQWPNLTHSVGVYGVKDIRSLKAVIDWLEKSPIYVWPYADIEYDLERVNGRINKATLTIKVDCAAVGAIDVSGQTTSTSYSVAKTAAKTMRELAAHIHEHTKTRIFIDDAK